MRRSLAEALPTWLVTLLGSLLTLGVSIASAQPPPGPSFITLATFPYATEGMTGDGSGCLYTAGRSGSDCPVRRVSATTGTVEVIGTIAGPCTPGSMAVSPQQQLYVVSTDRLYRLPTWSATPAPAEAIASGLPGANSLALDAQGNAWVSDGGTSQGRVWWVTPGGVVSEVFRVPPMVAEINVIDGEGGVGREVRTLGPGAVRFTPQGRIAVNTEGSQAIVANGLAFAPSGALIVADTARGALWRVEVDADGNLLSPAGCDIAFPANALCWTALWVAHPLLEGADGLVIDGQGNAWVTANERNALVVVTAEGRVVELFRNAPDSDTWLRNTGPLEFPTGLHLDGPRLCVVQTDSARRDNIPPAGGELDPTGDLRGKLNCLDQAVALLAQAGNFPIMASLE